MSVKTFTFRYDPDSDIGKWMASQAKKNVSLELAIQTLIGNFGYEDLCEIIPRQVLLDVETRGPRNKRTAKRRKPRIKAKDKPVDNQPSKVEPKASKTEGNDDDTALDMFSSL